MEKIEVVKSYWLAEGVLNQLIIGFCLISLTLFSCEKSENNDIGPVISIIPKGTTHVFWKSIQAGALKAGKEMGIQIIWIGPEKEDDRQQQIALVDNQVMNQVSGIVLAPIDEMALRRPVRSAVDKGIPVVIIDSGLKDSENVYTSYIATDNFEGGRIAAVQLAKLLDEMGKVIVLREAEGAASTEARANGFLQGIKNHTEIEIVSENQYVGVTKAQAQQAAENMLLRFSDDSGRLMIDGVFCPNESITYGMLQALRRRRLTGQIKFVGFDSSAPLIKGLEQGEIHGLVVQNPFMMGYLGVTTMIKHLNGKHVEKVIDTGVSFVTLDNIKQAKIQELINPDLDKWLSQ